MGTPIPSNTRTAESFAYIGSGSDALAVQEASQTLLAYKVREALKAKVMSAGALLENIRSVSDLINRAARYIFINYVALSPQKINDAGGNEDALSALFLGDGPKLGSNLADSKFLLEKLNLIGFSINTPIFFPILATVFNKDGQEIETKVFTISESERNALNNFALVASNDPKIEIREQAVFIEGQNIPEFSVRYTCYDGYANLRPSQDELNSIVASLKFEINKLLDEFASLLATTSKSLEKLQKFIDSSIEVNKNQGIRIQESEYQRQQKLIEILKGLQQLRLDLALKFKNIDEKNFDYSPLNNNMVPTKLTKIFSDSSQSGKEIDKEEKKSATENIYEESNSKVNIFVKIDDKNLTFFSDKKSADIKR